MVLITRDYKPRRKFGNSKYTLEYIGTLKEVESRKKIFKEYNMKTIVMKGKKKGFVEQMYLLYVL